MTSDSEGGGGLENLTLTDGGEGGGGGVWGQLTSDFFNKFNQKLN